MWACKPSNGRPERRKINIKQFLPLRNPFNIPLAIFLLTAGAGVWAAYDRTAAWSKFWLIAAGVLLYYGIAAQSQRNIWKVVGLLSICGAALAAYYFISPSTIEPDTVAGILAVIFPFTAAWGIHHWHKREWRLVMASFVTCGFMALAIIMSQEHGLWISLAVLAVVLPLAVWFRAMTNKRQRVILASGIALSCFLIAAIFVVVPAVHGMVGKYLNRVNPRLERITNTAYLAAEVPIIGGGLKSYAGLYSRYILVIPYLFQSHGHNLFLDVAVEQGWIGLAALLWILIAGGWQVIRDGTNGDRYPGHHALRAAALCSLFLLVFPNLAEDALYSAQGAVCLFIVPALSLLISQKTSEPESIPGVKTAAVKRRPWALITASGIVLILGIGFWRSLVAVFYANLGVVEMARVQLAGWPAERVEGERLLAVIRPAETSFQKALQYNSKQATALYRLGMIASEGGDYEQARQFLSGAYEVYPAHYGIRKMLGYSHLWLGDVDRAAGLLRPDSEILKELDSYTYWWKTQNREDLSLLAQDMATRLRAASK